MHRHTLPKKKKPFIHIKFNKISYKILTMNIIGNGLGETCIWSNSMVVNLTILKTLYMEFQT